METWKPIPEFEQYYEISDLGRVKRIAKGGRAQIGRILQPATDACGYLRIRLCRSATDQKYCKVHRLVLAAFVEPRGPEWKANHKNRIRSDNRLSNLEYLSQGDNVRYSASQYSRPGVLNNRAGFTESQVKEIRKLHSNGNGLTEIALAFKSNKHTIFDIVHRRSWKNI